MLDKSAPSPSLASPHKRGDRAQEPSAAGVSWGAEQQQEAACGTHTAGTAPGEGNKHSEGEGGPDSAPGSPAGISSTLSPQPLLVQGLPASPLPLCTAIRGLLLTLTSTSGLEEAGATVAFLLPRARPFFSPPATSSSSADFGGFTGTLERRFRARAVTWMGIRAGA